MFPMGIRIWEKNKMIYPIKFSVLTNLNTHACKISTLLENVNYETSNFMMLTTGIAINGYIYEKDIVRFNDDDNQVGIVEFDNDLGAFVANVNGKIIYVNGLVDFCEIIGNVYEDAKLYDSIKKNAKPVTVDKKHVQETAAQNIESKMVETVMVEPVKSEPVKTEPIPAKKEEPVEAVTEKEIVEEPVIIKEEKKVEPVKEEKNSEQVKEEKQPVVEQSVEEIPEVPAEEIPDEDTPVEFDENDIDENLVLGAIDEDELAIEDEFKLPDDVKEVNLYINAYCPDDDSTGVFAYIIQYGDVSKEFVSIDKDTATKRNELMALAEALKVIPENVKIKIFSNSKYVMSPFINKWIFKWHNNGWKKNKTDLIQNNDLWEIVYNLYEVRTVEWEPVLEDASNETLDKCFNLAKDEYVNM